MSGTTGYQPTTPPGTTPGLAEELRRIASAIRSIRAALDALDARLVAIGA